MGFEKNPLAFTSADSHPVAFEAEFLWEGGRLGCGRYGINLCDFGLGHN